MPKKSLRIDQACTLSGGSILGILFGFFCPLCVPASGAFFSAIGLSIFPQKSVAFPVLGFLIIVFLAGLAYGSLKHKDVSPLVFGILGAVALPLGRYVIASAILTYIGAFCILAASIWNAFLQKDRVQGKKLYTPEPLGDLLHTS